MRISLFGGSGRVGRRLIEYALAEGHQITALVRDPGKLGPFSAAINARAGDVLDPEAVQAALERAQAVLSVLGGAGLAAPGSAISQGMGHIVRGMRAAGIYRVIALAGSGVLDAPGGGRRHEAPDFPARFQPITREHLGTYRALSESQLSWTLVCAPDLLEGERTGRFRTLADQLPPGGGSISVEDVAGFMLDELRHPVFVGMRVGIAY